MPDMSTDTTHVAEAREEEFKDDLKDFESSDPGSETAFSVVANHQSRTAAPAACAAPAERHSLDINGDARRLYSNDFANG